MSKKKKKIAMLKKSGNDFFAVIFVKAIFREIKTLHPFLHHDLRLIPNEFCPCGRLSRVNIRSTLQKRENERRAFVSRIQQDEINIIGFRLAFDFAHGYHSDTC